MTCHRPRAILLGAAVITAGLLSGNCTPIRAPDRSQSHARSFVPVERGDLLPDFAFVDSDGVPVSDADLRGAVVVLTFAAPGVPFVDELLGRLAAVERRLASNAETTRFVVCTLDSAAAGEEPLSVESPSGWLVLTGPPSRIADLATRFGVMTWREDDHLAHTLLVVVVSPAGRITDMLEGLSPWTVEDLLASVAAAS